MRLFRAIRYALAVATCGYGIWDKLSLLLQQVRVKIGKGGPYSVVLSAHTGTGARVYFEGTYDEFVMLSEIFVDESYTTSFSSPKTILDLGANIGLAAVWFSLKFPDAVIHCYEPSERPRTLLQKNLPPNARIFPFAIAPHAGPLQMNMSERSVESSLVFNFSETTQQVTVEARTLDQAIAEIGGSVDIGKIDIEGVEFDVLAGATSLAQVREMVGEIHHGFAKREQSEIRESLSKTHIVTIPETVSKSVSFHAIRKDH